MEVRFGHGSTGLNMPQRSPVDGLRLRHCTPEAHHTNGRFLGETRLRQRGGFFGASGQKPVRRRTRKRGRKGSSNLIGA